MLKFKIYYRTLGGHTHLRVFVGLAGRDLARLEPGFVQRKIPDVVVRHASIAGEVNAFVRRVPTQRVNARLEVQQFLGCASFRRQLPKVGARTVHPSLLMR